MTDIKELVEVAAKLGWKSRNAFVVDNNYVNRTGEHYALQILQALGKNGCMIEVCNTHQAKDGIEWKEYKFIPLSQALKEAGL